MRFYVEETDGVFVGRCSEYEYLQVECDSYEEALDEIQELVDMESERLDADAGLDWLS